MCIWVSVVTKNPKEKTKILLTLVWNQWFRFSTFHLVWIKKKVRDFISFREGFEPQNHPPPLATPLFCEEKEFYSKFCAYLPWFCCSGCNISVISGYTECRLCWIATASIRQRNDRTIFDSKACRSGWFHGNSVSSEQLINNYFDSRDGDWSWVEKKLEIKIKLNI